MQKGTPDLGIITTGPPCGGTHALQAMINRWGFKRMEGMHRYATHWFPTAASRPNNHYPLQRRLNEAIPEGCYIAGHSPPFKTSHKVLVILRDPREILICQYKRQNYGIKHRIINISNRDRGLFLDFIFQTDLVKEIVPYKLWLTYTKADRFCVRYESIQNISVQQGICKFLEIPYVKADTYGRGDRWSGTPSVITDWWTETHEKALKVKWNQL